MHEKDPESYLDFLKEREINPENFLMVGNSLRSDVLPVVSIGGQAIHIPADVTWDYEKVVEEPLPTSRYTVLKDISELQELLLTDINPDS